MIDLTDPWAGRAQIPLPECAPSAFPTNDSERAARFAAEFADELKFVPAWKQWLAWDGVRWVRDTQGLVLEKAQDIPKLLLREAAEISDSAVRKSAASAACRAGDRTKLEAMVKLAESQPHFVATPQLFDSDPNLFGVSNGVVDLRTGDFRDGRRGDYITKKAGTAFDASATCPLWEQFLRRVLETDELVSFIKRAVGYSLTGSISEQCLFFLYGTGQNGKSTFAECLKHLFGDYMIKATAALYTLDRYGKEPETEIARLVGKRLVTGSETEEGSRLAESRVKDITGGDTLTGRELYCAAFNFVPTHKLWIYGNHLPDVRGNDNGIWRRLRLIPFKVQIPNSEKDPELLTKLIGELPGILNWALDGCREWRHSGLGISQAVAEATAEYREDEDEIGEFLSERCYKGGRVDRAILFNEYLSWAKDKGIKLPLRAKGFAKRLQVRPGITDGGKSGRQRFWKGVSVPPCNDAPPFS